jgi:hypothetical protein
MLRIIVGSDEYELEDVQENPARFAVEFKRAKITPGYATCLCATERRQLVIRRLGTGFILARWPPTGTAHDKNTCTFYDDERRSPPGAATPDDPFFVGPTGLNAKIDVSTTIRTADPVPGSGSSSDTGGSASRRSAGLLTFLEYLWGGANLHKWFGDRYRSWGTCFARLSEQIEGGQLNSHPMARIMHVMEPFTEERKAEIDARFQLFLERIARDDHSSRRGFFLCEIKEFKPSKFGYQVLIRQSILTRIFISAKLHDALATRFACAWSGIGTAQRRNAALIVLERNSTGTLNVIDMAAMLLNKAYLPCDSSYEVALADWLVAEHRRFTKPLRHVNAEAVHPDFVLTDVEPKTIIEVYGMSGNAKYDVRKLEKRAHYQAQGIPCIEWNPTAETLESLRLPSAVRTR